MSTTADSLVTGVANWRRHDETVRDEGNIGILPSERRGRLTTHDLTPCRRASPGQRGADGVPHGSRPHLSGDPGRPATLYESAHRRRCTGHDSRERTKA
jgi:hypothetical protein